MKYAVNNAKKREGKTVDKQTQRDQAMAIRRAMSEEACARASAQICRNLMQIQEVQNARTVFSYLAVPKEADLSALHQWLAYRDCQIAFPVTLPNGIMHAFAPKSPWRFELTQFDIRSPVPEYATKISPEEIDLVLAPCVAFDEYCHRLGHGGGYYDRFLPKCKKAILIGIAFERQKLPELICGDLDIQMDYYVTESSVYYRK